jgi:hypothetical protein
MPYLLDANVFINAKNNHYRFGLCPGFWDWLVQANQAGIVFSIDKVLAELVARSDDLSSWAQAQRATFFLPSDASVTAALPSVSTWANGQSYTPPAISEFFAVADYWLVGHGVARGYTVVTHEISQPQARARIKLPDACNGVGVKWLTPFQLLEDEGARFVLQAAT